MAGRLFYQAVRKVLLLLLLAGCAQRSHLQVAAAASLEDALRQIGANYEKATHEHVDFVFGGSNALARQVRAGAPIDIFFSADEPTMNSIAPEIVPGSRRDLLSNELAVVSLQPLRSIADLTRLNRIALADPSAVPAGVYARTYFERTGMWQAIRPRVIPMDNVRAALAAVDGGNADAAVVYRTDALLAKRAKIAFVVSGADAPHIRYPVAIVRRAADPAAAKRFLDYLSSTDAARVFRGFGFQVEAATTSSSVFQNRGYDFDTACSLAMVTSPRASPATAKAMAIR